jgi:hypothetical protein
MEALGDHSLAQRLHEIHTGLAVARRLDMRQPAAGVDAALTDLRARLNAFTIESLRKTLDGARDLPDGKRSDDLVRGLAERARGFSTEIERLETEVHRLLGTPERRFSPMAAAAASSLIFLFASASCGSHPMRASRAEAGVGTDVRSDSQVSVSTDAQPDSRTGSGTDAQPDAVLINPTACADEIDRTVKERLAAAVPCFSGYVSTYGCSGFSSLCLSFGLTPGSGFSISACDKATSDRFDQLGQAATAALAGLGTGGCSAYNGTSVGGDDNLKLANVLGKCGAIPYGSGYAIVLDSNGAVVDVRSVADGGTNSQILDCILAALAGLTFPCLANTQLCPEEIIVE